MTERSAPEEIRSRDLEERLKSERLVVEPIPLCQEMSIHLRFLSFLESHVQAKASGSEGSEV